MISKQQITPLALSLALALGITSQSVLAAAAPTDEDHSSSATQAVGDAWITTKVKAELATASNVPSLDIKVTTVDGVVTLVGVLPDRLTVERAVALTRGVDGVLDVDAAGLKVGEAADVAASDAPADTPRSLGESVDDAWITTKVKADLAVTDGVPATRITVKTENGVVWLAGALPSKLAVDKAIAAARAIKGVKQVDASALVVES